MDPADLGMSGRGWSYMLFLALIAEEEAYRVTLATADGRAEAPAIAMPGLSTGNGDHAWLTLTRD